MFYRRSADGENNRSKIDCNARAGIEPQLTIRPAEES